MRAGTDSIATALATTAAAAALFVAAALGAPAPAHAQSSSAAAGVQFDKGRALLKEGKYAEACAAFEQSQKLDPQIGTLYNLGICYAELGKIATAWNAFREVGQHDTKSERKADAVRRASALQSRVPKLKLTAPSIQGLVVTMNGVDISSLVGTDAPVDPGAYKLSATAPGRAPWEQSAEVTEGATTELAIELRELTAEELAAQSSERAPAPPPASERRFYGAITGATGLAVLATGLVFGGLAYSAKQDLEEICPGYPNCGIAPPGSDPRKLNDRATNLANISTGLVIGGAVVTAVGAVLWLTAPAAKRSSTALQLAPQIGAGHAGVALGGRF